MNNVIIDYNILNKIEDFKNYVFKKQPYLNEISFTNGYLQKQEGYKSQIFVNAKSILDSVNWDKKDISSGKIYELVNKAMNIKENNIIPFYQKTLFRERIEKNITIAEQMLFDIYCGNDDEKAFNEAISVFGHRYDIISYLFYIKDCEKYLPIKPTLFKKIFVSLNINTNATEKCTWENYHEFNSIIKEIQKVLSDELNITVRLIDAHSFLWITTYPDFKISINNKENQLKKMYIKAKEYESENPKIHIINSKSIKRNNAISEYCKAFADGHCELCGKKAPFFNKNGEPYLESHHIIWLSKGGNDSINNTVALCPNCHRRMHELDLIEDVNFLIKKAKTHIIE